MKKSSLYRQNTEHSSVNGGGGRSTARSHANHEAAFVTAYSPGKSVSLPNLSERPITTINPGAVLQAGAFREKKVIESQFKHTSEDIKKIRKSYKMQMSMLGSGNVTNKQLLAVAALDSATERNNGEF
eukprot:gene24738-31115_t